jgi:poly [ADP-ribose] polymerase
LELYFFQVSLGTTNDLLSADYTADKLPAGKHSVRGMGYIEPDPSMAKTL